MAGCQTDAFGYFVSLVGLCTRIDCSRLTPHHGTQYLINHWRGQPMEPPCNYWRGYSQISQDGSRILPFVRGRECSPKEPTINFSIIYVRGSRAVVALGGGGLSSPLHPANQSWLSACSPPLVSSQIWSCDFGL